MGEVIYQYDDLDRTNISKSALSLSCICCEDSFSYLIHVIGDNLHYRAKSIVFDKQYQSFTKPLGYLSEVLRDDHLLFNEFQSKVIGVRGVPFVKVAQDQLLDKSPENILAEHTDIGPNDIILTDKMNKTDQVLLFAIPEMLNAEIQMFYKNARVKHSLSSLLCHALSKAGTDHSTIHVNITHRWLEIVIMVGNDVKYVNHMRWYSRNDVVYYIAALLENIQLSGEMAFEFSGSAYQAQMHEHLIDFLSIEDHQIVQTSFGDANVLDLRTIGLCE